MPSKQIIKPAKSAPAVGPYNHAVRAGDFLFCAGQIPLDPATGNLVAGDIKAQTERVLENVKAILDDQKLTFANVVKSPFARGGLVGPRHKRQIMMPALSKAV